MTKVKHTDEEPIYVLITILKHLVRYSMLNQHQIIEIMETDWINMFFFEKKGSLLFVILRTIVV